MHFLRLTHLFSVPVYNSSLYASFSFLPASLTISSYLSFSSLSFASSHLSFSSPLLKAYSPATTVYPPAPPSPSSAPPQPPRCSLQSLEATSPLKSSLPKPHPLLPHLFVLFLRLLLLLLQTRTLSVPLPSLTASHLSASCYGPCEPSRHTQLVS